MSWSAGWGRQPCWRTWARLGRCHRGSTVSEGWLAACLAGAGWLAEGLGSGCWCRLLHMYDFVYGCWKGWRSAASNSASARLPAATAGGGLTIAPACRRSRRLLGGCAAARQHRAGDALLPWICHWVLWHRFRAAGGPGCWASGESSKGWGSPAALGLALAACKRPAEIKLATWTRSAPQLLLQAPCMGAQSGLPCRGVPSTSSSSSGCCYCNPTLHHAVTPLL